MSHSPVIGGSNPRKGDLLVIAGATLYAISNVSEVSWFYFCFKAFFNSLAADRLFLEMHPHHIPTWLIILIVFLCYYFFCFAGISCEKC